MVALTTVDDQHINDLFDDLQKLVLKKKSEDVIKDALRLYLKIN